MLINLLIRDIVLVECLDLGFSSGLSILSGETGAGKSILLDSLSLALGGRGDGQLVRHGKEKGQVVAVFDVPDDHLVRNFLSASNINHEGNLIFRRVQSVDGRTKAYINDQPVSVQLMRAAGRFLVENHGQHEDRALIDVGIHRTLLDTYAGLEEELRTLAALYQDWRQSERAVQDHKKKLDIFARDAEYLRFSIEELQKLAPQAEEESMLAEARARMLKVERVAVDVAEISEEFRRSSSPIAVISSTLRRLERKKSEAPGLFDEIISSLDIALEQLSNVQTKIESILSGVEHDPKELERVEERLFALRAASRKYSVSVAELPLLAKKIISDFSDINAGSEELVRLEKALSAARLAYDSAAQNISDKRRRAARTLATAVMAELPFLKLENACFTVEVLPDSAFLSPEGIDKVEFYVQTNLGERLGPLMKLASGGELSRFLLALKVVLAQQGSVSTLVFDEVDSGAGGAVADAIGYRLKKLSRKVQVLAVTHAPQVAARADTHLLISKEFLSNDRDRMVTRVVTMTLEERREEVARMLAGTYVTEEARAAAARLLELNM